MTFGPIDLLVLAFVGYQFMKKDPTATTTEVAPKKGLLESFKSLFGRSANKENTLLEKARLWQELQTRATDEQKAVLEQLWPILNKDKQV